MATLKDPEDCGERSSRPWLLAIFLTALALRWSYSLALFSAMGNAGLMGPDSTGYALLAEQFAAAVAADSIKGWAWLGPDLGLMPLFLFLLSLHKFLFAETAPITYVLMQSAFDAGSCLFIAGMARTIGQGFAIPAGFAAALNPTQIVLSGLVYTDTLFVFFVAMFLFASLRWLRAPSLTMAVLIGIGLGSAALCRILVGPWIAIHIPLLFVISVVLGNRQLESAKQLIVAAIIAGLCIAPIIVRNISQYNVWALTPQGGSHLAFWVAPLVKEAKDGTVWSVGAKEMQRRKDERFGEAVANPFEESRRLAVIGREALAEFGLAAVAKAWLLGTAMNIGTPAIVISPPVFQLPRTGFFATTGTSTVDKIGNFLFRSDNALYAWILLLGLVGIAIIRFVQLWGLVLLLRRRESWPVLILFGLWICYVLAVNGPIASPKYRLPIEPPLIVLSAAGIVAVAGRRQSPGLFRRAA